MDGSGYLYKCEHHQTSRHDVFLSYRVAADGPKDVLNPRATGAVQLLYDELTSAGLTCFWDKKCLNKGEKQRFLNLRYL